MKGAGFEKDEAVSRLRCRSRKAETASRQQDSRQTAGRGKAGAVEAVERTEIIVRGLNILGGLRGPSNRGGAAAIGFRASCGRPAGGTMVRLAAREWL